MGSDVEEILEAAGVDRKAKKGDAPPAADKAAADKAADKAAKKRKRDKARADEKADVSRQKAMKLSTGVKLLHPAEAAAEAEARAGAGGAKSGAAAAGGAPAEVPAALRSHHPSIQGAMGCLGFIEPTPVQEQCWPLLCEVGCFERL